MKIVINNESKIMWLFLLILLVSMMLTMPQTIIFFVMMLICLIKRGITTIYVQKSSNIKSFHKLGIYVLIFQLIFFVFQIIILRLDFNGIIKSFSIMTCLFIGMDMLAIDYKSHLNIDAYVKAFNWFITLFSLYYILQVITHGLPEDRDSVLGIVSSNYCAAILMLTYPLFFYYIFGRKGLSDKKNIKKCFISIALSLVVIILSGSRTAFGIVFLNVIVIAFLNQNKMRDKVKYLLIIIVGGVLLGICYFYVPSLRGLIERAITGLQGQKVVSGDVRILIWSQALENFKEGSFLFGSGSNMVPQYIRPAHNMYLEILLWGGVIGCILFGVSSIWLFAKGIKKGDYYQRFFLIVLLITFLIVGYVQPFFSTGYTCGIIIWTSLVVISSDKAGGRTV